MDRKRKEISDVKKAEEVIKSLDTDKYGNIKLTKNQIRKFLGAVNAITNRVDIYFSQHQDEKNIPLDLVNQIEFLKVKLAYQAGRDKHGKVVKDFVEKADLMNRIDDIGDDLTRYRNFAQYIEALVAYHRYYGGNDN